MNTDDLSDLSDWETDVSMMTPSKHIPPGLDRHMKETHEIVVDEEKKRDVTTRRSSPSKTPEQNAEPETVEFVQRKLNALQTQNQELMRWATYHLRERRAEMMRQIEQTKMKLQVLDEEIERKGETPSEEEDLSEEEKQEMYLKYARSVLNIRIYRKFAQTDDKHIVSAETLKLVTEAELRKIKLNAYDAELSRKIDEVLFEKSRNEMIVPKEKDMKEYMKTRKEEEEEEDFVQSTIRADPTLWSALAATTSSTATMPRATEFDIQRLENQCTTLSVECSEMRKHVTDTLNRILRGSVNPLLRYALATFLRTTVTTLMTAANAPPGPKRIALIRSLTENLQTPENLEGASKLRWEASLRVMRKQIENHYKVKIEEAERESVESRESLVKLYRNVSELRRTHEELSKMKSERENLETTHTRVSRRLETCLRRKRDMQSCLTQNETLSDLRARVRTVSFFFM